MESAIGVGELNRPPAKNLMSRRDFLKMSGIFGASAVAVYLGIDKFDTAKEKVAEVSLNAKAKMGAYSPENFKDIGTLEDLKSSIVGKTEALAGISGAGLYVSEGEKVAMVEAGKFSDNFAAGSLVKIPLMYEVWLKGQKAGEEYLNKEVAQKILGKSETAREFIMTLPFTQSRKKEGADGVIKDLLNEAKVDPTINDNGTLEVSMQKYFSFLRQTEFPPVMLEAMKQTAEDDSDNYGISAVMRQNYKGNKDIFFKLGLIEDGKELVNSFVMMIGDDMRLVGYARGVNYEQVHEHMLEVGAAFASYASNAEI